MDAGIWLAAKPNISILHLHYFFFIQDTHILLCCTHLAVLVLLISGRTWRCIIRRWRTSSDCRDSFPVAICLWHGRTTAGRGSSHWHIWSIEIHCCVDVCCWTGERGLHWLSRAALVVVNRSCWNKARWVLRLHGGNCGSRTLLTMCSGCNKAVRETSQLELS